MSKFLTDGLRALIPSVSVIVFVMLSNHLLFGQAVPETVMTQPATPNEEKFVEATDLVVPWRDSGCHVGVSRIFNKQDCRFITVKESAAAHRLALYNSDGSIWYQFSIDYDEPDYFLRNTKIGFSPLATPNHPDSPMSVILRLKGESPSWYEVEINEQSRETKFVSKRDPMWAKTTWNHWLESDYTLAIDGKRTKLLDKPNGTIVKESADLEFEVVIFLKAEGDWAYVDGRMWGKSHYGWIRWRKDRKILVGGVFNHKKVPESVPSDSEN